jgi:glutamate 5-kinase
VGEKDHQPLLSILSSIVETSVKLRRDGHKVILVSSGAIGIALQRMNLERRPRHLPQVQALAAIGQSHLMSLWESLFDHLGQTIAQILLTRNDIADRSQWQNAQNTLRALLDMDVIPIVNENDTLSVAEIKFGDNDTLSAITAGMVHADYLFLMTDVPCLYDKNPRLHADATPIEVVMDPNEIARSIDTSTGGSALGTGGMETKLVAARLASSGGVTTVITNSSEPGNIGKIVAYVEDIRDHPEESSPPAVLGKPPQHTRFMPGPNPIRDRYFWLLHGLKPHGTLFIDEGAYRALADNANLLPAGIVDVIGSFAQQEAVQLCVVRRLKSTGAMTPTPVLPPPILETQLSSPEAVVPITTTPTVAADAAANPFSSTAAAAAAAAMVNGGDADEAMRTPQTPVPKTPPSVPYELVTGLGFESGRAIVNYSAAEIRKIRGYQGKDIGEVLGYADSEYVALRENIAFLNQAEQTSVDF